MEVVSADDVVVAEIVFVADDDDDDDEAATACNPEASLESMINMGNSSRCQICNISRHRHRNRKEERCDIDQQKKISWWVKTPYKNADIHSKKRQRA